ncbi:MAG: CotY/CotZ family spore coat protein [bacterium]|nr:CotY/CotZ family spore coat protein [bacterium]
MNNANRSGNCICEILSVILVLQENACPENCLDTCDRPMLGGGANCLICNTRPVMLYTCCGNGTPWSMPTTKDPLNCSGESNSQTCSTVFRVEKIEGNCCTFRVLAQNTDETSLNPYVSTNSFFTMDCSCICAIKCLNDSFVDCVC